MMNSTTPIARLGSLALSACALSSFALPARAQTYLRWERIAAGLGTPTDLAAPAGDARLFVTSALSGVHLVIGGVVQPTPFLDLSAQLGAGGEGLASIAFHPQYAANGLFYVGYTDGNAESWVVEYQVSAGDPNVADPTSARVIVGPLPQPDPIHNLNDLVFGPDGMLYVGVGDGVHVGSPLDTAHDLSLLHGKILRLDVDAPAPHVPPDNPFVGVAGAREEIWAIGLRQPWRLDFDPATGELFVADVGKAKREEIDVLPPGAAGAGLDLGWYCLEGSSCFWADCSCELAGSYHLPVYEYSHHHARCAIMGGIVYRGSEIPSLEGRYVFSDFCTAEVWALETNAGAFVSLEDVGERLFAPVGATIENPTAIARDGLGELYLLDQIGGEVFRLRDSGCLVESFCVTTPNSIGPGATMGAVGLPRIADNDFELRAARAVPGQFGIFFYGAGTAAVPFGDGLRCVGGGQLFRLTPPVVIDSFGTAARPLDFTAPPEPAGQIDPGSTWYFQFWYRDPSGGPAAFNLSDGLKVRFCA